MNTTKEYPIVSVCVEELKIAGYDVAQVDDATMQKLAERMQESYLSRRFYKDLRQAATELGIPKIKKQ